MLDVSAFADIDNSLSGQRLCVLELLPACERAVRSTAFSAESGIVSETVYPREGFRAVLGTLQAEKQGTLVFRPDRSVQQSLLFGAWRAFCRMTNPLDVACWAVSFVSGSVIDEARSGS